MIMHVCIRHASLHAVVTFFLNVIIVMHVSTNVFGSPSHLEKRMVFSLVVSIETHKFKMQMFNFFVILSFSVLVCDRL